MNAPHVHIPTAESPRPLFLAKVSPTEILEMDQARLDDALVDRHIAAIATPETAARPDPGVVTRALLADALSKTAAPDALLARAASVIRRSLSLDFGGAYLIESGSGDRLTLIASEGLPDEFCDTARTFPLWDFGDIADMPYNGSRPPCYGDFFAPVAALYGVRAWLVASLSDPQTTAVRGALLLGSRDSSRIDAEEAARILHLAAFVSQVLSERFPAE